MVLGGRSCLILWIEILSCAEVTHMVHSVAGGQRVCIAMHGLELTEDLFDCVQLTLSVCLLCHCVTLGCRWLLPSFSELQPHEDGWVLACFDGRHGMVPCSYIGIVGTTDSQRSTPTSSVQPSIVLSSTTVS